MSSRAYRPLRYVGLLVALLLTIGSGTVAGAQSGDVPVGAATVDTVRGERIGRQALVSHLRGLSPPPPLDPVLDGLARDQLRIAIDQADGSGTLGAAARVLRVAPDTLVRLGVVGPPWVEGHSNLFSLVGPRQAEAAGSAGGVAPLRGAAAAEGATVFVAAVAWRDDALAAHDDLTAAFGPLPQTPDDVNAAAAQRWLDQENRRRVQAGFPPELLARRNPVLDREAENILRGARGEPLLPPLGEASPGVEMPGPLHANSRTCQPNCEPFWLAPDRFVDAYRQTMLEDQLGSTPAAPVLLNFDLYTQQRRWLVGYWDSYRLFGLAVRVRTDQEVVAHRPMLRELVERLAPGAADVWDPREYPIDVVVVGSDPWPTP